MQDLNNVSTDVLIIIFSKLVREHSQCYKYFSKHEECIGEWWEKTNRGCSCKTLKLLSLVCKRWYKLLHKLTKRVPSNPKYLPIKTNLSENEVSKYYYSYTLSFTTRMKTLFIDTNKQLCVMFMKDIKNKKYDIILDGDTIFVNRLLMCFKDWCNKRCYNPIINSTNFKKIIDIYNQDGHMNFKIIDV